MQFDRDGTQEEQAFEHAITYVNNYKEEVLVNHVNIEHMKLMVAIREKQLRKIYYKITVFVNGLSSESSESS
jgi:hypothetical protein